MIKAKIYSLSFPEEFMDYIDVCREKISMNRSEFFKEAGKYYIKHHAKKLIEILEKIRKAGGENLW